MSEIGPDGFVDEDLPRLGPPDGPLLSRPDTRLCRHCEQDIRALPDGTWYHLGTSDIGCHRNQYDRNVAEPRGK